MASTFPLSDAWFVALGFTLCMSAAWMIGWRRGRRAPAAPGDDPGIKFTDASMALLGLLLAFTFSMALGRHDSRRVAVVAESNAIADFYTCATLLNEPVRTRLQAVIADYARLRLELDHGRMPHDERTAALQKCLNLQTEMTDQVAAAVREGTAIAVPLTNTLNNLTSSYSSRLAAYQESLPLSIVLLLLLSAIVPAFLVGQQQGESAKTQLQGTFFFMGLVGLVIFVVLDLNQPAKGLIKVNLDSLEQVVRSVAK